jgi:hypothetical protein
MKFFKLIVVFALSFFGLSTISYAVDMARITDKEMVRVLNGFEIIAEKRDLPIAIRVLRVRDQGECDSLPGCAKETLYFVVSTFDDAPDQSVYMLPKSYDWQVTRWKLIPHAEGPDHYIVLEVKERFMSGSTKKWVERYHEIGVNPWKAYMKVQAK